MIVSVSGDVDVSALPSLQSALDRSLFGGAAAIVLDLGEVDSIDSMGLALVSGLPSHAARADLSCAMSVSNPEVRAYLDSHGVDTPMFPDVASALASFEAAIQ